MIQKLHLRSFDKASAFQFPLPFLLLLLFRLLLFGRFPTNFLLSLFQSEFSLPNLGFLILFAYLLPSIVSSNGFGGLPVRISIFKKFL